MSLIHHLALLESAGLVHLVGVQPELEYAFRHSLVQDAAYDSLLKTDRRNLHLAVGNALEQIFPERQEELAPLLAGHFDRAEEPQRALKYYTLAGDAAFAQYANQEAVLHYSAALRLAAHNRTPGEQLHHLFTRRGRALELMSQYNQALANYNEMEKLAQTQDQPDLYLAALMAKATLHGIPSVLHNEEVADSLLTQALELANRLDDQAAKARILWGMSNLAGLSGLSGPALEYGSQALEIARRLDLRELLAYILNDFSQVYFLIDQLPRAREMLQEAQALWRELDNQPMLADNLGTIAFIEYFAGNYDQVLQFSAEAMRISQAINNPWGLAYSQMFVGQVYELRGDAGRAAEIMQACIKQAEKAAFVVPLVLTRGDLAMLYCRMGDLSLAQRTIQAAVQAAGLQAALWLPLVYYNEAQIWIQSGELDKAAEVIRRDQALIKTADPRGTTLLLVPLAEATLAFARGEVERALALNDALEPLRESGLYHFVPEVCELLGRALLAKGEVERAAAILEEARQAAEARQARRPLWSILFHLSRCQAQRGQRLAAQQSLEAARQIVGEIADRAGSERLRRLFLALPQVRAVLDGV